ncbi:MAG: 3-dehydroquinate synthase [Bacteroidota bacterium]
MTKIIKALDYSIEFGSILESNFQHLLSTSYSKSKKIILVDENTHEYCLEYLITSFPELAEAEVMLLPQGEENKVMEVCFQVWEAMSEYKISRKDLIINLGGGMVTDMGGFIAAIYKRGLDFINIPTTLLAMVDASVGGKTGIDLGSYKNQLGVFANPKAIFVDEAFLSTLPQEELNNGLAEMLKHALIKDVEHWANLIDFENNPFSLEKIMHSVSIKNEIVLADPKEENERKKLNFGHTFGHAIEGFFLHSENQIKHGHAVALGILCETYLSYLRGKITIEVYNLIHEIIESDFEMIRIEEEHFDALIGLMQQDKKNRESKILCVLLNEIGDCSFDEEITKDEILEVLKEIFKSEK